MRQLNKIIVLIFFIVFSIQVFSQTRDKLRYQHKLDSLLAAGNFPGLSVAIVFPDNQTLALTTGYNDREKGIALKPSDMMLQGSVGKTYVSAIAMQLVQRKQLRLDDKVGKYLGHLNWYSRVPNHDDITIRMLMNHTSGIMRYEFKPAFTKDLTANPDKVWQPAELLSYVLDEQAPFKAGEGWDYSDTNYILLGMIIEQLTGKKLYQLVQKNILDPLSLRHTFPSNKRKLIGLSQGYAGEANDFGGKDKVVGEDGQFIINPQFEWTGGGFYSTTLDLARWSKALYEGKIVDSNTLIMMLEGVPAKLGKDTKYGLGVIMRPTALGNVQGHSGFFPGYLTEMFYFPHAKLSIAVQANTSDVKKIKFGAWRCLLEMAALALEDSK